MWRIMGRYKSGEWEEIDTAESKASARYLLGEYQLAFGQGWALKIVKS